MAIKSKLVCDAIAIWMAAAEAVKPRSLFSAQCFVDGHWLHLRDEVLALRDFDRIVVVGAGKASAAMAVELERQCLSKLSSSIVVQGWINAPEGSFLPSESGRIHLHAARPSGINVPTQAAVEGTERILELVRSCARRDLCIVLLSGGGSALLVAPVSGITLTDKQVVARRVAAAGGNIQQLNAIRRAISSVKAGKLARACRAGRLLTLIISDVLGNPLDTIASGPTFQTSFDDAMLGRQAIVELGLDRHPELSRIVDVLNRRQASEDGSASAVYSRATHVVLGNNAMAVDAAGAKSAELGYRYVMQSASQCEGDVSVVARLAADAICQLAAQTETNCWISGGEPTVKLPAEAICGRGGRNQQLALLTMIELHNRSLTAEIRGDGSFVFLSGGTDGEDGPTDAAGAWIDQDSWERADHLRIDASRFAGEANAYEFFEQTDGLLKTGPSGTNVCDIRVAIVHP